MMSRAQLLLATALFHGEVPEGEKVARLSPYFSPPPSAPLLLSTRELRDFGGRVTPLQLRGEILIKPPSGTCFTINRPNAESEVQVCRPSSLSFMLEDLDNYGRLHWQVSTGDGDFGAELVWPTPYRVALTVAAGDPKAPLTHKYVGACTPKRDATGRRIELALLSGETWVIRFPAVDFMPPQPPGIENLTAIISVGKIGVGDAAEAKKADEAKAKEEEGQSGEHAEKPAPKAEEPIPTEGDDRKDWAIPWRGSYVMNSDALQTNGSVPPRINKGRCRYIFNGPTEDTTTGRLECHEVDGYKSVYVPLTCLRAIGPEAASGADTPKKPP